MSENIKNILVINSLIGGGAERQFSILIQAGLFSNIICLEQGNVYLDESIFNIQCISKHNEKTSSIFKYLYTPIYAYKIYKIIKQIENPTITAVLERSHITVWLLSLFKKINYILSFQLSHKIHYKSIIGKVLKYFFQKAISKSTYCIPNSLEGGKEIKEMYNVAHNKVQTIINGYDFNEIKTRANDYTDFSYPELLNEKYILCVARFFEQKAQDKLIEAFVKVKATNQSIKLVFAGVGPLMDNCIRLSNSLGLKTFTNDCTFSNNFDVYFLGFQKNPLILMKNCKLFVFPTYYEGLPNALIEAMICGAVPVSSDCPTGPREILASDFEEQTHIKDYLVTNLGILVAPFTGNSEDIVNWEKSIVHLLNSSSLMLQMQENIKKQLEKYKIENIKKEWSQILSKN